MKKIKDISLFECIKRFLTEDMPILRKKSSNTVDAYRYTLNLYIKFLCQIRDCSIYQITAKDFSQKNIMLFVSWLTEERDNKPSTVNLRLRHLKRFCRFLMEENVMMMADLAKIQKISEIPIAESDIIVYLSVEETKELLAQPDENDRYGLRNSFMMFLLYDSGCRIQEVLDLKLKDFCINKGSAELHVVGKGNKFRVTPISDELIPQFEKYRYYYHKQCDYNDYLFYTVRNGVHAKMSRDNVQSFLKKYGDLTREHIKSLPQIHPHLLRHTRAMHLYMAGMPLELVSQWLGHSQIETSLIYARATTDMKRKAIEKISTKENSVFASDEAFKYENDEEIIKQLYGLL